MRLYINYTNRKTINMKKNDYFYWLTNGVVQQAHTTQTTNRSVDYSRVLHTSR